MSSTSSTPPTTTSDQQFFTAGPTETPARGGGNSSSLYLFTFLATLFLLLTVSAAIILRSFIVRRRFRRRVEEAILAGEIPPQASGTLGRRQNFGEKPTIWDSWVQPAGGEVDWANIMPVSLLPGDSPGSGQTKSIYPTVVQAPTEQPRSSPAPAPEESPSQPPQQDEFTIPSDMQVSVLIAMPDARRSCMGGMGGSKDLKGKERSLYSEDFEDEELPDMVIGVAELPYRNTDDSK
ncbi:hypothetical protein EWM64_g842 [Hericium alpestre]|uniref:Uncharacterized protein n=1 Tax=Hericium alpestre TaxID=135208 RepID=A0A4Z0AA13_9AGAM|nr:hypothetical protein EWM64_g842 [Hericium alpestre]